MRRLQKYRVQLTPKVQLVGFIMSIGENLKALRSRAGLTQGQLSERSGMQLTQISRIENNDTDPKASTINKLMKALGCSADDLFIKADSSKKYKLEEFLDETHAATKGLHNSTQEALMLWRLLDDHQGYIDALEKVYENESHPNQKLIDSVR
jgi:transcriptional regulator with XRE-family HTH domain